MNNQVNHPSDNSSSLKVLCELILQATEHSFLRKVVLSKSRDTAILRGTLTPKCLGGKQVLQLELFCADHKALHRNFDLSDTANHDRLAETLSAFRQINLLSTAGDCEYRCSKSGTQTLIGSTALRAALEAGKGEVLPTAGNNKQKQYILSGHEPFLVYLGVSDKNGRVYDKKQAKFRQINRFLEQVRDIVPYLPAEGVIRVSDLCCGKSYLSFAVYHYLTAMLGRTVQMTGMDLKKDVIDFCNETAQALHYDGLTFFCGDIGNYKVEEKVHMVISLHACDTATDLVLGKAIEWQADVILSTPCCHHALFNTIRCPALSFITDYGILKQKLCDAATDALRLKLLQANGYTVSALELIDPEDTPKNVLLRAIRQQKFDPGHRAAQKAMQEYLAAKAFLEKGEFPIHI